VQNVVLRLKVSQKVAKHCADDAMQQIDLCTDSIISPVAIIRC